MQDYQKVDKYVFLSLYWANKIPDRKLITGVSRLRSPHGAIAAVAGKNVSVIDYFLLVLGQVMAKTLCIVVVIEFSGFGIDKASKRYACRIFEKS